MTLHNIYIYIKNRNHRHDDAGWAVWKQEIRVKYGEAMY